MNVMLGILCFRERVSGLKKISLLLAANGGHWRPLALCS